MGKYILVYPQEIADIPDPGFPWKGYSEEDYKNFLSDERVQKYITGYDVSDPAYDKSFAVGKADLHYVFIDTTQAMGVMKSPDGYVYGTNGRHRLYIAKKYNLLVLALYQGEISSLEENENPESLHLGIS